MQPVTSLTKRAIRASFLKLLNERPLNKITVKDIVEDCGINRNSFYYHYTDIPALAEEIVRGRGCTHRAGVPDGRLAGAVPGDRRGICPAEPNGRAASLQFRQPRGL